MTDAIGRTKWAIPEGYIPEWSHGKEPELTSHETVCILNTGEKDAEVSIMVYYENRDPSGPYTMQIPAKRTKHIRFNELSSPEPIEKGMDFASVVTSSSPVVVQHTRLDSRQNENALMSTIAYPV